MKEWILNNLYYDFIIVNLVLFGTFMWFEVDSILLKWLSGKCSGKGIKPILYSMLPQYMAFLIIPDYIRTKWIRRKERYRQRLKEDVHFRRQENLKKFI